MALFIYIFVLLIAGEDSVAAQNVQTGHYAPGWNGNLKAGMMAQAPSVAPGTDTPEPASLTVRNDKK